MLSFRIVAGTRSGRDGAGRLSGSTFPILVAFLASPCACILLLSQIGLDTIALF